MTSAASGTAAMGTAVIGAAVIADQVPLTRHGLSTLASKSGWTTASTAATYADGLRDAQRTGAAFAIVGTCPDARLIDAVGRFSRAGVTVAAVASLPDILSVYQLYQAGALGVTTPTASEEEFAAMFSTVAGARRFVSPTLLTESLDRPTRQPLPATDLTPREYQVLGALAEGRTNSQIADYLCIGAETVKTHLASIYMKLSVTRRSQAVSYAIRHRLL